jgi:imidazolonepropionase
MEGVGFSVAQTERVFDCARKHGLPIHLHGDQLHGDMEGGALAARYGALSCGHCEYTNEASVAAMAEAGTVAVLLPTSNYFIRENQVPPVASFRKAGVPMALATNCNPGSSPCTSLLLVMNMACTLFHMTPEEALAGVTRHAAAALGEQERRGTVEVGKFANLAVWDVESPGDLAYNLGLNPLTDVWHKGSSPYM